jgi:hypothetical protein
MHDTDRVSWILEDDAYIRPMEALFVSRMEVIGTVRRPRGCWVVVIDHEIIGASCCLTFVLVTWEEQTNKCKHRSSILLSAGVWYRHDPFSTLLLKPSVGLSGAFCLPGHVCCYLPVSVWFSLSPRSFSGNLAVGRIWLLRESEYREDCMWWSKIKESIKFRMYKVTISYYHNDLTDFVFTFVLNNFD